MKKCCIALFTVVFLCVPYLSHSKDKDDLLDLVVDGETLEEIVSNATPVGMDQHDEYGYVKFLSKFVSCFSQEDIESYDYALKDLIIEITLNVEDIYFSKNNEEKRDDIGVLLADFLQDEEVSFNSCTLDEIMQRIPTPVSGIPSSEELSVQGVSLDMSPEELQRHIDEYMKTPEGKKRKDELVRLENEYLKYKKISEEARKTIEKIEKVIKRINDLIDRVEPDEN